MLLLLIIMVLLKINTQKMKGGNTKKTEDKKTNHQNTMTAKCAHYKNTMMKQQEQAHTKNHVRKEET